MANASNSICRFKINRYAKLFWRTKKHLESLKILLSVTELKYSDMEMDHITIGLGLNKLLLSSCLLTWELFSFGVELEYDLKSSTSSIQAEETEQFPGPALWSASVLIWSIGDCTALLQSWHSQEYPSPWANSNYKHESSTAHLKDAAGLLAGQWFILLPVHTWGRL